MATIPERADAFASEPRLRELWLGLLLWLAVTVTLSSLAAPPIHRAIESFAPGSLPFDRVFRRVAMLVALVHLVVWLRRAGVRRWRDAGFTRAGWSSGAAGRGAAIGSAAIAALLAIELAGGARTVALSLGAVGVAKALAGAAAVGLLEEGVCRGALVFPFGRLRGAALALAAGTISAIYSTGHFARGRARFADIDWTSGFELWSRVGAAIAGAPAAWLGLLALGLLFDALVRRQGHVWGAVGLHAGAVAALQLGSDLTDPVRREGSWFFANGLHPAWPLVLLLAGAWLAVLTARRRSGAVPVE